MACFTSLSLKKIKIHVGLSLNNNLENLIGNDYNLYREVTYFDTISQSNITVKVPLASRLKSQNFLYISKKINDRLNVSLQALATGFLKQETPNTIYIKGTYGLYVNYKPGKFALKANGFYQNGKNTRGDKVSAYFINVRGDLKLEPFIINAGIDYHSGQNAKNDNSNYQEKDHLFDLFYGGRHQYYGYMDLFDNLSKSSAGGGLVDLYAGIKYIFIKKSTLALDHHYFSVFRIGCKILMMQTHFLLNLWVRSLILPLMFP